MKICMFISFIAFLRQVHYSNTAPCGMMDLGSMALAPQLSMHLASLLARPRMAIQIPTYPPGTIPRWLSLLCKIPFIRKRIKRCRPKKRSEPTTKPTSESQQTAIFEEIVNNLFPPDAKRPPSNTKPTKPIDRVLVDDNNKVQLIERIIPKPPEQVEEFIQTLPPTTTVVNPPKPISSTTTTISPPISSSTTTTVSPPPRTTFIQNLPPNFVPPNTSQPPTTITMPPPVISPEEFERVRRRLLESSQAPPGEPSVPVNPINLLPSVANIERQYRTKPERLIRKLFQNPDGTRVREQIFLEPEPGTQPEILYEGPELSQADFNRRFPNFVENSTQPGSTFLLPNV